MATAGSKAADRAKRCLKHIQRYGFCGLIHHLVMMNTRPLTDGWQPNSRRGPQCLKPSQKYGICSLLHYLVMNTRPLRDQSDRRRWRAAYLGPFGKRLVGLHGVPGCKFLFIPGPPRHRLRSHLSSRTIFSVHQLCTTTHPHCMAGLATAWHWHAWSLPGPSEQLSARYF